MHIKIIAVGKLKEKYLAEAVSEYEKRLSRFAKLEIVQLPDVKIPDRASDAEEAAVLRSEGDKILEKIPAGASASVVVKQEREESSPFSLNLVFP